MDTTDEHRCWGPPMAPYILPRLTAGAALSCENCNANEDAEKPWHYCGNMSKIEVARIDKRVEDCKLCENHRMRGQGIAKRFIAETVTIGVREFGSAYDLNFAIAIALADREWYNAKQATLKIDAIFRIKANNAKVSRSLKALAETGVLESDGHMRGMVKVFRYRLAIASETTQIVRSAC